MFMDPQAAQSSLKVRPVMEENASDVPAPCRPHAANLHAGSLGSPGGWPHVTLCQVTSEQGRSGSSMR